MCVLTVKVRFIETERLTIFHPPSPHLCLRLLFDILFADFVSVVIFGHSYAPRGRTWCPLKGWFALLIDLWIYDLG